jgi:hypothetical protein
VPARAARRNAVWLTLRLVEFLDHRPGRRLPL